MQKQVRVKSDEFEDNLKLFSSRLMWYSYIIDFDSQLQINIT